MLGGLLVAIGAIALLVGVWTICSASAREPSLGEYDGIRVLHGDLGYGYHFKHNGTGWTQWGFSSTKDALQAAKAQRITFDQAVVDQFERQFESHE